jgi:diacylglycerol kinase family enzyme
MCAGAPSAAEESCASRNAPTASSASGTATISAVRRSMLASVKRAVLIVNPYSTQVTGERITAVERVLRERIEVLTKFTQRPGHATELVAEYAGDVDAIIVFSGDGTDNEALNADGDAPFGFLPGGGTSVLPRALGLSRDPVEAARSIAEALDEGRVRRISLGDVNGRRFCFSAGLGFDGEAVRRLNALGRAPGGARPGDLAFGRMVVKMLLERRGRWDPQLEIEGFGRAAFVLVANGDPYSYAGSVPSSRRESTSSRRRRYVRTTCPD